MNEELKSTIEKYPLCGWLMRVTLMPGGITVRDYNFLQNAVWSCRDKKPEDFIAHHTGPILLGTRLYETASELRDLFREARRHLYEELVPKAIFPNLEGILLVPVAAMQTERTLVWDSSKASQWMQHRDKKINHWLIDDIFVLCCIGQLVQNGLMQSSDMLDWFTNDNPARTAYELEDLCKTKPEFKKVLHPVAEQFWAGRWKAAANASNKSSGHPCQNMRAFAAAGLDLVEYLPLLGQDGKTPSFGEIHDPIHQGGIAYFKN